MKRRKESDYVYNSDYVIFYEHSGWHFGDSTGIKGGTQINVAFLDTHVKTVTITFAPGTDVIDGEAVNSPAWPDYDEDGTTGLTASAGSPGKFTPNGSKTAYYDPQHVADQF